MIIESAPGFSSNLVVYSKSDDIRINASDLTHELRNFKYATENSMTLPIFLGIASLWVPIFTTEKFVTIGPYDGNSAKLAYIVFAIVVSLYFSKSLCLSIFRVVLAIPYISKYFYGWLSKTETDPERKTRFILEKCKSDLKVTNIV